MPTFQHAIGQGRASCGWGSPLFRVEDEGDGRNDVRVAHTRPIVGKGPVELPSGQMLPRRRDRAGTRTWRSLTSPSAILATCHAAAARLQIFRPIWGKFGPQSGPDYPLPRVENFFLPPSRSTVGWLHFYLRQECSFSHRASL